MAFGLSLEVFQFAVASLNLTYHSGIFSGFLGGYSAHLSWCVISGSSSFRRAISVCMNLLYAVSFLRPPPPEDLTVGQVSQPICILIVGRENAPFLSGFSLVVFFSLGIDLQLVDQMCRPENTRSTRADEEMKRDRRNWAKLEVRQRQLTE